MWTPGRRSATRTRSGVARRSANRQHWRALRRQTLGRCSMSGVMAEPTSSDVVLGDVRLHYLNWANDGAPALLLLHGFTGHAHQWDFFAEEWRRDFHVLALDQRGHGDSDRADRYGSAPMVEDLGAFLD